MESKLIQDFLAEQVKLMNAKAHSTAASKQLVKPKAVKALDPNNVEESFNYIIEKKPSNAKVKKFLQATIDKILEQEE
jgi:hypothetical protein